MKKYLLTLMLVILAVCMFVACKDEPEVEKAYYAKVHLDNLNSLDSDGTPQLTNNLNGDFYFNIANAETGASADVTVILFNDPACLNPSNLTINFAYTGNGFQFILNYDDGTESIEWNSETYKETSGNITITQTLPLLLTFSSSFSHVFYSTYPWDEQEGDGDYIGTLTLSFEKETTFTLAEDN